MVRIAVASSSRYSLEADGEAVGGVAEGQHMGVYLCAVRGVCGACRKCHTKCRGTKCRMWVRLLWFCVVCASIPVVAAGPARLGHLCGDLANVRVRQQWAARGEIASPRTAHTCSSGAGPSQFSLDSVAM